MSKYSHDGMLRIGWIMFKCLLSPACYCSVWAEKRSDREKFACCASTSSLGPPPPAASSMNQGTLGALLGALLGGLCASVPRHRPRHEPAFPAASLADFTAETASYLPAHIAHLVQCSGSGYLFENYHCNVYLLIGPRHDCQVSGEFVIWQKGWDGTNNVILVVETSRVFRPLSAE